MDVLCEWSLGFVSIVVVHAPLKQSLESLATLLSEVAGGVLLLYSLFTSILFTTFQPPHLHQSVEFDVPSTAQFSPPQASLTQAPAANGRQEKKVEICIDLHRFAGLGDCDLVHEIS